MGVERPAHRGQMRRRGAATAADNARAGVHRQPRVIGTPELMADYARLAVDAGARIIGGCCGTSPEHLAAMRVALDTHVRAARPSLEAVIARTGALAQQIAGDGEDAPAPRRNRRRG